MATQYNSGAVKEHVSDLFTQRNKVPNYNLVLVFNGAIDHQGRESLYKLESSIVVVI